MSKTPLCDSLAFMSLDTMRHLVREDTDASLSHMARLMLRRLNNREEWAKVVTHAALISTSQMEVADHIRAYMLSGRKPWK